MVISQESDGKMDQMRGRGRLGSIIGHASYFHGSSTTKIVARLDGQSVLSTIYNNNTDLGTLMVFLAKGPA